MFLLTVKTLLDLFRVFQAKRTQRSISQQLVVAQDIFPSSTKNEVLLQPATGPALSVMCVTITHTISQTHGFIVC